MRSKDITIYGAGISGLVAAINLSRDGFNVIVREKRSRIGGAEAWHPSVHQQRFNVEKTSDYIGIDISPCFLPVENHEFYFYGKKFNLHLPVDSYICEKGPQSVSIESYLYNIAKACKVNFEFGMSFNAAYVKSDDYSTIVATGLETKPYNDLGVKHIDISGFRSCKKLSGVPEVHSYFGDYTNHDFAYVASTRTLMFALLFARRGVDKNDLNVFIRHLNASQGIKLDDWLFSRGAVPLQKNLVVKKFVLAGTISGMIDPFYFNGISAALVSGKIASLFFIDKEKALNEFKLFTKNFYIKKFLRATASALPLKRLSFPAVAMVNNYFKWVGVV